MTEGMHSVVAPYLSPFGSSSGACSVHVYVCVLCFGCRKVQNPPQGGEALGVGEISVGAFPW